MSNAIHWIRIFWADWGPIFTLILIPSIITGLSKSPSTVGASKIVQQVWDVIKQVLSYISTTKFKDEPGTFQLPVLTAARRTKKLMVAKKMMKAARRDTDDTPTPPPGIGTAVLSILLLMSLFLQGCCAWTGTCTGKVGEIGNDIVDCGKASLKQSIANLIPTVLAIITGGSINWEQQLNSLVGLGGDALSCALVVVAQDIQSYSSAPATSEEEGKARAKSHADYLKAKSYLEKNHINATNTGM